MAEEVMVMRREPITRDSALPGEVEDPEEATEIPVAVVLVEDRISSGGLEAVQ